MTPKDMLPPEGRAIEARRECFGRTRFLPTEVTSIRSARFATTQIRVLRGHAEFPDSLSTQAAYLLLFDGIATRSDWISALVAMATIYEWQGNACLDWIRKDGRQDRRVLSVLTTRHESELPAVDVREAELSIRKAAEVLYPRHEEPVKVMLGDAQAWLLETLPGALLGHVLGTNPQVALSRTALARQATGKALAVPKSGESDTDGATALGLALEAYFQPRQGDGTGWLVDELVKICHRKKNLLEWADKRRMLTACMELARCAERADSISTLILAWAIDLIESGTLREADIHPGTIEKYVRLAASSLRIHLQDKKMESLSARAFAEIYEKALAGVSDGQKCITASALSSWHSFLVCWLDVPSLEKSLYDGIDEILPRANAVWPHEVELIRGWLSDAPIDERLREQVKVALEIAMAMRIRASELFHLRLRNLRRINDALEIEVCPMLRDGRLKSSSARRVVEICDLRARDLVLAWITRREKEDALGEDLLFGDPHRPQQTYRLGLFYVMINQLLKAVTGDREVSLHTLSHTWISSRIHDALVAPALWRPDRRRKSCQWRNALFHGRPYGSGP